MTLNLMKKKIKELNFFENEASRNDPFENRTTIISTRVYLVLLTTAIIVLIVSVSNGTQIKTNTVLNPDLFVYVDLENKYGDALSCPCTKLAIPYGSFVSVSQQYHPICSSYFVSDVWIETLAIPNMTYFYPTDFRSSASGHFRLIAALCEMAMRFVDDGITAFFVDTFISPQTVSANVLKIESQLKSTSVRTAAANVFMLILDLIKKAIQSNQLQTAMQTTAFNSLYIFQGFSVLAAIQTNIWIDQAENYCYCNSNFTCTLPVAFFNLYGHETHGIITPSHPPLANVSGFFAGCYPIESILQSSLECLFDTHCLDTLAEFFHISRNISIHPLPINGTRYSPNTTISTITEQLFIETWIVNNSFSAYFSQCFPASCTYTFEQKNTLLFVLTTLLSLYGGLTVALRLMVPRVVGLYRRRHQTRPPVIPTTSIWQQVRTQLMTLNIFKNSRTETDDFERQTSIISTRTFLVLLILSIGFIIVYLSVIVRIQIKTLEQPSYLAYRALHEKYSATLECPCSSIAFEYGSFIALSPEYHPVCSSIFVSQSWFDLIARGSNDDSTYDITDFRWSANYFFTTLAMLCKFTQSVVTDAWRIFNQSVIVSRKILGNDEFSARINSTLKLFQANTIAQVTRSLEIIEMQMSNGLAATQANVYLATYDRINSTDRIEFHWVSRTWSNCTCFLTIDCKTPVGFFSYPPNYPEEDMSLKFFIPNFFIGCSILQSVLQSSLECFFNQSCLLAIQQEMNSTSTFVWSSLDLNSSRFQPETLLETILADLMIEKWNDLIDYERYFARCRPNMCSYTIMSRNNPVYIFTTLLGLFGGLTAALRIITPQTVGLIRNRIRQRNQPNTTVDQVSIRIRLRNLRQFIKVKIFELNMFDSEDTWFNENLRYTHIVATRIYLILLSIGLIVLMTYNVLVSQHQQVTILKPTQTIFEQLSSNVFSSSTLQCPCQNLTIPYKSFISLEVNLHQFCSSDFVEKSDQWLVDLYYPWVSFFFSHSDFRHFAVPQIRLLISFCRIANQTINNALAQYESQSLISNQLETRSSIETRAQASIDDFIYSTARNFRRTIDFSRYMMIGNQIISTTLSNWQFFSLNTSVSWAALWTEPHRYEYCSCDKDPSCTSPAFIDDRFVIGFLVGCDPFEALLKSTLECFYQVYCIATIQYMYVLPNTTLRPLNRSLSASNSTVSSLLDQLFVQSWNSRVNYDDYFYECASASCFYSFNAKPNIIYSISTVVGLFGGLNVFLKMLVPNMVRFFRSLLFGGRFRIQPTAVNPND